MRPSSLCARRLRRLSSLPQLEGVNEFRLPYVAGSDWVAYGPSLRSVKVDPLSATASGWGADRCGLRFGEAAGLAPKDVVVGGVYVRRAVSETSRGLLLGLAKDHEERFVELRRYVQRVLLLLADDADGEVRFATRRGGLLSVSSFHSQVWKPTLRDAGVPHRRIKALRALAASLWLDARASIEFVRGQLGHADLRTMQKYLETFSSRRESIMSRLDDRLESRSDVGLVWGSKGVAAGGA